MADGTQQPKSSSDRRTFLKIGAGVVAGAAIASVVEIPYYSSVIGGNNNSSSTTVSSLQDELSSTKSQLSDTQNSLSATQSSLSQAQGSISNLNSQLTATQGSLSSANAQLSSANSQLSNVQSSLTAANSQNAAIAQQLTSTEGYLSTANAAISTLETQVNNANSQVTSLQSQNSSLETQTVSRQALVYLNNPQQALLKAVIATVIPTDSNGPGGTTAGSIYFIDGQLNSAYGFNGNMYSKGPFVQPNVTTAITINNLAGTPVTYSAGTPAVGVTGGTYFQYAMNLNMFWEAGMAGLEAYANAAYGGNFETLSAANQVTCLQDLFNNKPTAAQFTNILPSDFAHEMLFMVWAGFLSDPVYGGNQGKVGWSLLAFTGLNSGDFYGEGYTYLDLINSTTLIPLKPASIGDVEASLA